MAKKKSGKKHKKSETTKTATTATKPEKMSRKDFEKELLKLQTELCHLQTWVKQKGLRVIVIFPPLAIAKKLRFMPNGISLIFRLRAR
jgi:polyphosphate kinase 2 (PPK2 family)